MMKISTLKFNIIFVSHIITTTENNNTISVPSLPEKPLNACLGRCDLQIQTKKLGSTYMKIVTNKRDNYIKEDIKNPTIIKVLDGTIGLFDKPKTLMPNNKINNTEGTDK